MSRDKALSVIWAINGLANLWLWYESNCAIHLLAAAEMVLISIAHAKWCGWIKL